MDSGHPLRQHVRYDVQIPLEVRASHWPAPRELTTMDISESGAFVVCEHAENPGTEMTLAIPLEEGTEPLVLRAKVVRAVSAELAESRGLNAGLGVQFLDLDAGARGRLGQLIAAVEEIATEMAKEAAAEEEAAAEAAAAKPPPPDPAQVKDLAMRCEQALADEKWAEAFDCAAPLYQMSPGNRKYEMFYHLSGGLSRRGRDTDAAVAHLEKALQIDPYHQAAVTALREIGQARNPEPVEVAKVPFWKRLFGG